MREADEREREAMRLEPSETETRRLARRLGSKDCVVVNGAKKKKKGESPILQLGLY